MRDLHYNYILLEYGKDQIFLLTHSVNLLSEICTDDVFENLKDKELFDLSECSEYTMSVCSYHVTHAS